MENVSIDPAQITAVISAIETAVNVVVSAIACVCFFLGMNSWESSAK
jgi:hypothetical protein